jgi:hypothetical protein
MDFTGVPIAAGFVGELSWDHAGMSKPAQIKTAKSVIAILFFIYPFPFDFRFLIVETLKP